MSSYEVFELPLLETENCSIPDGHEPLLGWDGSHLGSIKQSDVKPYACDKWKFQLVTVGAVSFWCQMIQTADWFPVIIDNLKPVFGLARRGTYRVEIGKLKYVLYYLPVTIDGQLPTDLPLHQLTGELRSDPDIRLAAQQLLIFRDIMALQRVDQSSLFIRNFGGKISVLSTNELRTVRNGGYVPGRMSNPLFSKWFHDYQNPSMVLGEMIGYDNPENDPYLRDEQITITLFNLRSEIDATITAIDSNYLWYTATIIGRVTRKL